ncbi:MAG: hypothetical protein V1767_02060 [Chloroflexota bacterium]
MLSDRENEQIFIQSPVSTQQMQTTRHEYWTFWEKLGWLFLGPAETLPGFSKENPATDWGCKTKTNQNRML